MMFTALEIIAFSKKSSPEFSKFLSYSHELIL